MTEETKRDGSGKFVKGSKGISKGRPKKVKVEDSFKEELKALKSIDEKIEFIVNHLVDNCEAKDEMFKYVKELLPYYKPKLKNIENKTVEDRNITIKWLPLELEPEIKTINAVKDYPPLTIDSLLDQEVKQ